MLSVIFFVLFGIATIIHLIDTWRDKPERRRITKPMLLLFLTLYYVFTADKISIILILALATSWLGDVLLIPESDAWFVAGGISFMISHFLFITVYVLHIDFSAINWLIIVPVALVYYGIALKVILTIRKNTPKMMLAPMYIYLIANSTMNVFAIMQLMTYRSFGSVLAVIGALLFFASDCSLFLVRYHDNKNLIFKKHFTVMVTYIAGECLITMGMLLIDSGHLLALK